MIGIHPKALLNFDAQSDELKAEIKQRIRGYKDPIDFYVSKLTEGIATIASAFWPNASLFVCLTLSRTNTATWLVVKRTNRMKKTQC